MKLYQIRLSADEAKMLEQVMARIRAKTAGDCFSSILRKAWKELR